ncbi:amidase [Haloarcula mannanilytica]|uniref:Amidase n=1 Tax=Haloarcula mannanilytica TaxID=2509225 RepID=A0A4C2EP96_9EURY|nr:amidase [Haloarcula mannanilytica]GCF14423.1 amidase [Haloarcula mannanilytica]
MIHSNQLAQTVAKLQDNSLSVEEYLEELRTRTEAIEPKIESLLPESDRWSRLANEAEQLPDTGSSKKALYGIPVGVKDIMHASGFQTRANSSLPAEQLTGPEATVVRQLKSAGALVFGKTVTAEFAYAEPGPTKNPHDTNHTPGGSSSGSAAAVAAGLCPLALGTQTIGSIIRPASFCGIVGFKPSYSRVSTEGVIPVSQSVDHVGFFTQDVAGAEIAASVLCEEWQTIPEGMNRPTIGIPNGPYLQQASSDGLERFRTHCSRLERSGYDVKEVSVLPDIKAINKYHERLMAAEAAMVHHEWYQEHGEKYADQTAELITEGYSVPTKEIAVGRNSRIETRESLTGIMDDHDIDIWIAPGACGPAPEGIDSTGDPIMNLPWTHAGLPTIAIPTGDNIDGLPVAVQCISKFNTDEHLLKWGHDIAQTLEP